MAGFQYVVMVLLVVAATLLLVRARARAAAAGQAAALASQSALARGRMLDLLSREVGGSGLALLGVGQSLSGAPGGLVTAEARRLLGLAEDIVELQASEAGPRRLKVERVALLPLLREAVEATAGQLGPGRRQWRLAPEFEPLVVDADRRALRGAIVPVLARAARSSRDGDWIDVKPVLTADGVAIVVEDEGAGLGADDLGVAAARGPGAEGTRGLGSGLAVARSLIEAHGGALRLEALSGVGARAWLTLPRARLVVPGSAT